MNLSNATFRSEFIEIDSLATPAAMKKASLTLYLRRATRSVGYFVEL